jgi:hypothetical protein
MPDEQFTIVFDGYWLHEKRSAIPDRPGVFCVYSCQSGKRSQRVETRRLLYIGGSCNVREDVETHERINEWLAFLQPDETLCYGHGTVTPDHIGRCAAALVFRHKPLANDTYVYRFPFPSTVVNLCGATDLLCSAFTVPPA